MTCGRPLASAHLSERCHSEQRVVRDGMVSEVRRRTQRFDTAHLPFRTTEETSRVTWPHPHHPPENKRGESRGTNEKDEHKKSPNQSRVKTATLVAGGITCVHLRGRRPKSSFSTSVTKSILPSACSQMYVWYKCENARSPPSSVITRSLKNLTSDLEVKVTNSSEIFSRCTYAIN